MKRKVLCLPSCKEAMAHSLLWLGFIGRYWSFPEKGYKTCFSYNKWTFAHGQMAFTWWFYDGNRLTSQCSCIQVITQKRKHDKDIQHISIYLLIISSSSINALFYVTNPFECDLKVADFSASSFYRWTELVHFNEFVVADLSRNRFCDLPSILTTFPFLEMLLLNHNIIRTVPETIKQLRSLTYLDLRGNQLTTLPRELCFLPVQVLLVSNNRLTSLPDELGRMEQLTDLEVSYNQLTSLPVRMGELRSIRALSLRNNELVHIPRGNTSIDILHSPDKWQMIAADDYI